MKAVGFYENHLVTWYQCKNQHMM